jgi:hypothetical protein
MLGSIQVEWIAAPTVSLKWLLRLEQPRAHRIETNVIARALEVAGAAAVPDPF